VRTRILWPCLILAVLAAPAAAQLPPPLDIAGRYAFPGVAQGPGSAATAGCALADRWLGDEPFDNPAAAPARGVMAAPVLQRVKRQDLPTQYRNFDQTPAFLDLAGGWLSLPMRRIGIALYAYHPVLRREDEAFTTAPDQVPGSFTSTSSSRELRAGLALSAPWRAARVGVAVEWTRRDDSYDFTERSGDPFAGLRHADFSGSGIGAQAGVRVTAGSRVTLGAAVRRTPALDLTGNRTVESPPTTASVAVTRAAGWEGGVSAAITVTPAFRALVSAGGRSAQSWDGFEVTAGREVGWAVGFVYDESEDPWAVRFGLGQEQQDGVPEPRAGLVGLGLTWKLDALRLEAGVLHRSIARAGKPNSFDDRLVAGATVPF